MSAADETNALRFGNYEVLTKPDGTPDELGRGGFGRTYRARHIHIHTDHALKVILDRLIYDKAATERFLKEAREQAALRHPGIAQITDFGIHDGALFYVMEFCSGGDLKDYVRKAGPLSEFETFSLIRQAAQALGYAHGKKLIHRDIKPANLMLVFDDDGAPQLKIIDFGLVKRIAQEGVEEDSSVTRENGGALWSPAFASPEQIKEAALDERSDIFSLGMTAWFLLQGGGPVEGTTGVIVADRLGPDSYEARLPKTLSGPGLALLAAMVEKDHRKRIKTCADVIRRIDAVLAAGVIEEVSIPVDAVDVDAPVVTKQFNLRDRVRSAISLAQRFSLERHAQNYLGEVFRGTDFESGLPVRVTKVSDRHPKSVIEAALERVASLVKLRPAGIVPFLEMTEFEEGWAVVEEEIVGGLILGEVIRREGAVEFSRAAPVLWQAADGLEAAVSTGSQPILIERSLLILPGNSVPGSRLNWPLLQLFIPLEVAVMKSQSIDERDAHVTGATIGVARTPLQSLATLIYLVVGSRPVPAAAYHSSFAYAAIPGLSEEGNVLLGQAIAGEIGGSIHSLFASLVRCEPSVAGIETVARAARAAGAEYHRLRLESWHRRLPGAAKRCREIITGGSGAIRGAEAEERFRAALNAEAEVQQYAIEGDSRLATALSDGSSQMLYDHGLAIRRLAIRAETAGAAISRSAAEAASAGAEFSMELDRTAKLLATFAQQTPAIMAETATMAEEGQAMAEELQLPDFAESLVRQSQAMTSAESALMRLHSEILPAATRLAELRGLREDAIAAHAARTSALQQIRTTVGELRGQMEFLAATRERDQLESALPALTARVEQYLEEAGQAIETYQRFSGSLPPSRVRLISGTTATAARLGASVGQLRRDLAAYLPPARAALAIEQLRTAPAWLEQAAEQAREHALAASALVPDSEAVLARVAEEEAAAAREKESLLASLPNLQESVAAAIEHIEVQLGEISRFHQAHRVALGSPVAPLVAEASRLVSEVASLRRTLSGFQGEAAASLDLPALRLAPAALQRLAGTAGELITACSKLQTGNEQALNQAKLARFEPVFSYIDACAAYTEDCFKRISKVSVATPQARKSVEAAQAACHSARREVKEILKIRNGFKNSPELPAEAVVESLATRASDAVATAFENFGALSSVGGVSVTVPQPPLRPGARPAPPVRREPEIVAPPQPDPAWVKFVAETARCAAESEAAAAQLQQEAAAIPAAQVPAVRKAALAAVQALDAPRQLILDLQQRAAAPPADARNTTRLTSDLSNARRSFDSALAAAQRALAAAATVAPRPRPAWEKLAAALPTLAATAKAAATRSAADCQALPASLSDEERSSVTEAAYAVRENAEALAELHQSVLSTPELDEPRCTRQLQHAQSLHAAALKAQAETTRLCDALKQSTAARERSQLETDALARLRQLCAEAYQSLLTSRAEADALLAVAPESRYKAIHSWRDTIADRLARIESLDLQLQSLEGLSSQQATAHQAQLQQWLALPPAPKLGNGRRNFLLMSGGAAAAAAAGVAVMSGNTKVPVPPPPQKVRIKLSVAGGGPDLTQYERDVITVDGQKLSLTQGDSFEISPSDLGLRERIECPQGYDIEIPESDDAVLLRRPIVRFIQPLGPEEKEKFTVNGIKVSELAFDRDKQEYRFPADGKSKPTMGELSGYRFEDAKKGESAGASSSVVSFDVEWKKEKQEEVGPQEFEVVFNFPDNATAFAKALFQKIKLVRAGSPVIETQVGRAVQLSPGAYTGTLISSNQRCLADESFGPIQVTESGAFKLPNRAVFHLGETNNLLELQAVGIPVETKETPALIEKKSLSGILNDTLEAKAKGAAATEEKRRELKSFFADKLDGLTEFAVPGSLDWNGTEWVISSILGIDYARRMLMAFKVLGCFMGSGVQLPRPGVKFDCDGAFMQELLSISRERKDLMEEDKRKTLKSAVEVLESPQKQWKSPVRIESTAGSIRIVFHVGAEIKTKVNLNVQPETGGGLKFTGISPE